MLDRNRQDQLRDAYADASQCPPPESFLRESLDGMTSDARQTVADHVAQCPRCASEQVLAAEFDRAGSADAASQADVDAIVANLKNLLAAADRPPTNVRSFPAPRTGRIGFGSGLAAAAAFAIVIVGSVAVWRSTGPALPQPPGDAAVRGSRVELVTPLGEIAEVPTSFEWVAVAEAASYRVRLFEVDRTVLFETTTDRTSAQMPPEVASRVAAAVVYTWQVEALDAAGKRLAWSEAMRFRVKPRAEE